MTFRLTTMLWVFALFAAGMAAFQGWGILPACCVLGFWFLVDRALKSLVEGVAFLGFLFLLLALTLPAVSTPREVARINSSVNNLRQLALAVHGYFDVHGQFPPPEIRDSAGQPLFSWRTAVLPDLGQRALHDRLDQTLPWDDPVNSIATASMLDVFRNPACKTATTTSFNNYYAVVGPGTVWDRESVQGFREVEDGSSNTIMLIEGPPCDSWAEPKELTMEHAIDLLTSPVVPGINGGHSLPKQLFHKPQAVRLVAFVDGHTQTVRGNLTREQARALLTARGEEPIHFEAMDRSIEPELDRQELGCAIVFALVAALPALRHLQRKPKEAAA